MIYNHHVLTRSLYIHWPFCPYKCHFCPFVALASQDQFMAPYHKALCAEIEHFGALYAHNNPIDTIFLGGGTPSTYPNELLLDMVGILKKVFEITPATEFTIEVNPGTVVPEQLEVWKQCGINRLSIGVQSLKDSALKKLNRHQSADDVYRLLKQVDGIFDNVSVDLILGLPEVSESEWKELLHKVVSWPIKHCSLYFLTVHEDTPLYFKVQKQQVALLGDESMVDLYYWSINFLREHGFMQYEISNFAQPGFESRHNTVYWERKPYKGFGLGACSFDGVSRFQNEKNLMKYCAAVTQQGTAPFFAETLQPHQIHREKVMLGLRRACGVLMSEVMEDLSLEEQQIIAERIEWLMAQDFVYNHNGYVRLTVRGLSVENEIAMKLTL